MRRALPLGLIAIGTALRVWQYLADQSLWFDELSIARNVRERSLADLVLQPLRYDQIAPPGFIASVKASALLFGSSELALRLFPFLCGIIAPFLFWRVAAVVLDGAAVPVALALFALGAPFIRYTAELKQYGVDVAATLTLTLVALDLRARLPTWRRCLVAGAGGLVIVWFSQAAVLVLVGLGAALTLGWLRERDSSARWPVLITVPIWGLASLAALLVSLHQVPPDTLKFMHAFWLQRHGFFPLHLGLAPDTLWMWDRIAQFFTSVVLNYPWPTRYAGLAVLGFVVLWQRCRDVALLLLAPLTVTLAAAIAQQYPFRTRVVLFLVPTLLLTTAAAIEWIRTRAAMVHPTLGAAAMIALVVPPLYAVYATPPPYYTEAFKPVLGYLQAQRRAGDMVYAYTYTYEALDHYGARFGLPPGTYVLGICDPREVRRYLEDVDQFRGSPRVWVISAAVPDFKQPRRAIRQYLQTIGIRRDSVAIPSRAPLDPVSAELFDLSDASRLQSATAATFRVEPIADTLPPLCRDWIRPTTP